MSLGQELERRVVALRRDKAHGATDLAREALNILREAVEQNGVGALPALASALSSARPAMAAIKNVVQRVAANPAAVAEREAAIDAIVHAREWLDYSSAVVAEQAAELIPEDSTIVTCSFSSLVIRACGMAAAERPLRVMVLESRVRDASHGERLAQALRAQGVTCELVADEGMAEALADATLVLVGADRVMPSGALVNGVPSLELAQAASAQGVPFYAACEAFKLDEGRAMEAGFDLIPAGLVTGYVTEHGITSPREVWAVHQRA